METHTKAADCWYNARGGDSGGSKFVLAKVLTPKNVHEAQIKCMAPFPWHLRSLESDGLFCNAGDATAEHVAELANQWKQAISPWIGSTLIGTTHCAYILRHTAGSHSNQLQPPLRLKIPAKPDDLGRRTDQWHVGSVAWALNPSNLVNPIAILAVYSMIYLYDVAQLKLIGRLRGHGGQITHIAVHPRHPYIFLTTSRDHTTRLYDLHFKPRQEPNNPFWPPSLRPSHAGPAFGLHSSEPEGDGIGRCIAVLVGGRAGGHQAAVLHSSWHPRSNLIATCGADRAVKIWRVPEVNTQAVQENREHLIRDDKPLFSTELIHRSRVMSIWWLSDDILMSYSAPGLVRGQNINAMFEEPGIVTVWQWLGFDRFAPGGIVKTNAYGCVSDWRNSESFKLVASYSLPVATPSINLCPPQTCGGNAIILIPDNTSIRAFKVSQFRPRDPPVDQRQSDVIDGELARRMGASNFIDEEDQDEDDNSGYDEESLGPPEVYEREEQKDLFAQLGGLVITSEKPERINQGITFSKIQRCELSFGGSAIMGFGHDALYIWRLR